MYVNALLYESMCFLIYITPLQATGVYSGFIASENSNTGTSSSSTMSGSSYSMSAMPSGSMPAGGGGVTPLTDQKTFGYVWFYIQDGFTNKCLKFVDVGLTRRTLTV